MRESAQHCEKDVGKLRIQMGFLDTGVRTRELDFDDITRLTTALGCAALTLRGSDKSIYGKLFERLMLGSVLTILGFQLVKAGAIKGKTKVFWLSDSTAARESDATVFIELGKLARFDIGFIGPGNSEISKDKLSRYERDLELDGATHTSKTFIVVDRLPQSGKRYRPFPEVYPTIAARDAAPGTARASDVIRTVITCSLFTPAQCHAESTSGGTRVSSTHNTKPPAPPSSRAKGFDGSRCLAISACS